MKWLIGVLGAVILIATTTAAEAHHRPPRIEVMSQNLYLGADLSRLLDGEEPGELLITIQQTDFPSRAVEIAKAIDDFNPDVIGLQEVFDLTVFDIEGNTSLDLDYLEILMTAIEAEGESYAVASSVTNADVTLPIAPGVFGRVVDHDVIIYRTSTTTVSEPHSANFSTNFTVPLGGTDIEFTRGYTSVNTRIHGQDYRFVNTHLEVAGAPCGTTAGLAFCQDVQAVELIKNIADTELPTILVGDFNAEPGATAYETIDDADFLDTWTIRYPYNDEPGYTCCQSETLDNEENQLSERIDHIFVSEDGLEQSFAITTVVGDWDQRKTESGLWYSEHGGPWARMVLSYSD
ncbi:MAG: endonuclease/exonuclease/phosphatase family protein [Acidimicrobiales bacterium]